MPFNLSTMLNLNVTNNNVLFRLLIIASVVALIAVTTTANRILTAIIIIVVLMIENFLMSILGKALRIHAISFYQHHSPVTTMLSEQYNAS